MSRIIEKLNKTIKKIVDLQVSILLAVFYFLFVAPLGAIASIFKDYLLVKSSPSWEERREIKDIGEFLKNQ
jgi:hypothetical protein